MFIFQAEEECWDLGYLWVQEGGDSGEESQEGNIEELISEAPDTVAPTTAAPTTPAETTTETLATAAPTTATITAASTTVGGEGGPIEFTDAPSIDIVEPPEDTEIKIIDEGGIAKPNPDDPTTVGGEGQQIEFTDAPSIDIVEPPEDDEGKLIDEGGIAKPNPEDVVEFPSIDIGHVDILMEKTLDKIAHIVDMKIDDIVLAYVAKEIATSSPTQSTYDMFDDNDELQTAIAIP
jgi:hypothetical protein